MSFLDPLLRKLIKIAGGTPLRETRTWNFVSGVTGVYNESTGETDLTVTGGGEGDDGAGTLANSSTGVVNDVVTISSGVPVKQMRFTGVAPVVHGFASGTDARRLVLTTTGGPLVLANEDVGSIAANRIHTGTGGSVTIDNGTVLVYDGTSSRWRISAGRDALIRGIPISGTDGTAPPIGGTQVYNAVGTASYKQKKPVMPGYFDVENYGAIPDYVYGFDNTGFDNADAFEAAMDALHASGRDGKIIADGQFYFSRPLVIKKQVHIEGTGIGSPGNGLSIRKKPGTMLVFPANCDGIIIQSGTIWDGMDFVLSDGDAVYSRLSNMSIWCNHIRPGPSYNGSTPPEDGASGNGITMSTLCFLDHVAVENFAGDGILLSAGGDGLGGDALPGGADGVGFTNCVVSSCGGHGFHIMGHDAQEGTILNCSALGNFGYGFWDESEGGNSYVGCYCEANNGLQFEHDPGHSVDFKSVNLSTYFGCYTEGGQCQVDHPGMIIGNLLGQRSSNLGTAMSLSAGRICNRELVWLTEAAQYGCPADLRMEFGQRTGDGSMLLFGCIDRAEYTAIAYDFDSNWWGWRTGSGGSRTGIRFPSLAGQPRRYAALFSQGILFGPASGGIGESQGQTAHEYNTASPTGGTYEVPDVVWNKSRTAGGSMGWVCTVAGTMGTMSTVHGNITIGTKALTVTDTSPLHRWDYITIVGVSGVKQITNITGSVVTIDSNADATVTTALLAFSPATFEPIESSGQAPVAVSVYDIDWSLGENFYKTIAAGAQVFTFSNAADGQIITVEVTGSASTLTWPTVLWPGGTPPMQTASGTDVYTFKKRGSDIYGTVLQAFA